MRRFSSVVPALALLFVAGSAAAGRLTKFAAAEPGSGILAYQGTVSQRTTSKGIETKLSACTASVIDLPGTGPRIVTARHCDGHDPSIFTERRTIVPTQRREIPNGPDVAVLETAGPLPEGLRVLSTRASSSLREGEELCAFRTTKTLEGLTHERVCGKFAGTTFRLDGGRPRLVVNRPFEHGTSGSPLLDAQGRAVGIVVSTTASEGFAEPIEEAGRAAKAVAFSTKLSPPPFESKRRGVLGGLLPSEGSMCLPGFCLRWEL